MFKMLGVLLSIYVVHCLMTGAVLAKSGAWGRTYRRDENALGYWGAVGSYSVLVLALFFLF
ncbi:MAG: hypothetical protein ACREV5_06460 [Steroidobacter sp.]